jgi:uncharacterized protein (TIGR02271 family)
VTDQGRGEQYVPLAERYSNHQVLDRDGDKIGKVDNLFVDENDELEYIGVKMGFLETSTTLIPAEIVTLNDESEVVEVSAEKETVKDGPTFDDDQEITPEYEARVREYYGLGPSQDRSEYEGYGDYYSEAGATAAGSAGSTGESDVDDEDELRVGRSEEELRASKREREVGGVNVRKRVRTDRERMTVPKRREEVKVDRVPVEGEASESEIGEDEVRMPITEEEVEVTKRPVQKEEIRIRKESVEEEEVVEEDVRKEEIEVDDDSQRR